MITGFMMKRECLEYSYQKYDNPLVREIRLLHKYRDNDEKGDCCEVIFQDGSSVIHKLNNSAAYTSQYGVPLSDDGKMMFICDWYLGLTAYDTQSGSVIWRMKKPHIRMTQLFDGYGVTVQYGKALIQFDLQSGEVLNIIGSSQIEKMFYLKDELVLVSRCRGSECILNCRTMSIVEKIPAATINPHRCLSFSLRNVFLKEGVVTAVGTESLSLTEEKYKIQHNFERVIHVFTDNTL